jgi:N-acetylneuraminate synthase
MEFREEEWLGLRRHAAMRGLLFLSSPFSIEAAELLTRVGVAAWKIASGELTNPQLFDYVSRSELPILLSTGMSTLSEIDSAVDKLKGRVAPLAVLQCTSEYPCPPERVGLNMIELYRARYRCGVGLSDHSGKVYASFAAATLGIDVLELHLSLSRDSFGPDVPVSLTTDEMAHVVEGVRYIETLRRSPVNKDLVSERMHAVRQAFTRSVVASRDLDAGTLLQSEHLALRKPAIGIPADRIASVVSRTLKRPLKAGEFLSADDLESLRESPVQEEQRVV